MAKVSNTLHTQASLFLLFVGKKQINRVMPWGWRGRRGWGRGGAGGLGGGERELKFEAKQKALVLCKY